jgi:hypothetical protein
MQPILQQRRRQVSQTADFAEAKPQVFIFDPLVFSAVAPDCLERGGANHRGWMSQAASAPQQQGIDLYVRLGPVLHANGIAVRIDLQHR